MLGKWNIHITKQEIKMTFPFVMQYLINGIGLLI